MVVDVKNRYIENEAKTTEIKIRPSLINEFVGQSKIKENLRIFIEAANQRAKRLDHIILYGPPGLGKTTLANIIANELNTNIKTTTGPAVTKTGDLAAILTNLKPRDVLFIDEIHRLPISVEEMLYSAMEDGRLDIVIGEGASARIMKIELNPFTVVGATTRLGLVSKPLQDRFGIVSQLEFYNNDELSNIIKRLAKLENLNIEGEAISIIAKCSRGTPRIAIRLTKRIIDFSIVLFKSENITLDHVKKSLEMLGINNQGLDSMDMKYLKFIRDHYNGGPVGIETIAAALSEDKNTIEDTVEPYLIQLGILQKTIRGRVLIEKRVIEN